MRGPAPGIAPRKEWPMRTDFCESAKRGQLCIDDLCHSGGETLCGFCPLEYAEMLDEEDECTCDLSGGDEERDNCPVHYPIDDGSEDEENI